jgi:galactokinase
MEDAIEGFQNAMGEAYRQKMGKEPIIHVCSLKRGTEAMYSV